MASSGRNNGRQWNHRVVGGYGEWVTSKRGFVPVDLETGWLGGYVSYRDMANIFVQCGGRVAFPDRGGFFGVPSHPGRCDIGKHVIAKHERLTARREMMNAPNQRFVLVGHSMGTAINAQFAARYPDFVSSMIDIGGIGEPHGWSVLEGPSRLLWSVRPPLRPAGVKYLLNTAAPGLLQITKGLSRQPRAALEHIWMCRTLDNSAAELKIGKHGIPVTIIRGALDTVSPEDSLHKRADRMRIPDIYRIQVENHNHLLGVVCPDVLRDLIAGCMQEAVQEQVSHNKRYGIPKGLAKRPPELAPVGLINDGSIGVSLLAPQALGSQVGLSVS